MAVRADLRRRAGDTRAALDDYERPLGLVTNEAEHRYLTGARRRAEDEDPAPSRVARVAGQLPANKANKRG
jgi:hypothetical protein